MNLVKNCRYTFALSLGLMSLSSAPLFALPNDKNEPTHASMETMTVDQKKGISTYSGDVKIQQGSLVISADIIVAHTNADGSVEKMVATGSPARFQQKPGEKQGIITAAANSITYTPGKEHLLLVENASLEQDGAVMSGPKIEYDLIKEVMKAAVDTGKSSAGQRIEIVIPPKSEQKN